MPFEQWFRRDAARKAGQHSGSRAFTLGGLVLLTALLAGVAAVVAIPLRDARERQMVDAACAEIAAAAAAAEAFRAAHYRFPDHIEELETVGYAPGAGIEVCRFLHVADARNFDDHLQMTMRHRGSGTALVARYPAGGRAEERPASDVCRRDRAREASR